MMHGAYNVKRSNYLQTSLHRLIAFSKSNIFVYNPIRICRSVKINTNIITESTFELLYPLQPALKQSRCFCIATL